MMKQRLIKLIESVPELMETASVCNDCSIPNYYIAGGAITQIIWNDILGKPLLDKVKDFDIVYFDQNMDLSDADFEQLIISKLTHGFPVDVKNQAIVHEWYPEKFGQTIEAYDKVEGGISSWLSAFAIGFRLTLQGDVEIYAPYGLDDAFGMNVRPNKKAMTEASYLKMTSSFKERWGDITVFPWVTR
ncbi:hypothetical protein CWO04_23285 [Vibrio splendidus]|nr:nucleotidyltransferase family protein [Vibrio splendidus]OEF30733.1 hypothetical protein A150_20580 [Vibrio splendidus 1S-124]PTP80867.1 hypothetical protein CWO04_23285 [Vibrio splendidus]PTQ20981.1 hypothetical protein CWO14_05760 [Vibrio splendidus]